MLPARTRSIVLATLLLLTNASLLGQGRTLSLVQIEKLLQIHSQDSLIAQVIGSRGIDFVPTDKILSKLKQLGAGGQTLAALRERIPVGTLEIETVPQASVSLDGETAGTANMQGQLELRGVIVGPHVLRVVLVGYNPVETKLQVSAKEVKKVPTPLSWAGGYLTIKVVPNGAIIRVDGREEYKDQLSNQPLSLGEHSVAVSHAGMKSESRSLAIAAGQHVSLEISMTPDPEFVAMQLKEARNHLSKNDPRSALQILGPLHEAGVAPAEVDSLVATAYLALHDYGKFESSAMESLSRGGTVLFDLLHEHLDLAGESIHEATVSLSSMALTFDMHGSCKYGSFSGPLNQLDKIEVTDRATSGGIYQLRHLTPGTFLLHLEFKDQKKPGKHNSLSFALAGSRIVNLNNANYLESSGDSNKVLESLARVIRTAQDHSNK